MRQQIDDDAISRAFDRNLAGRGTEFVKPYWKHALIALVAMMLTTAAGILTPYLTKVAIDEGITKNHPKVLMTVALLIMGVYLLYWAAQYAQARLVAALGQRVIFDIRHKLFSHIQSMSQDFFDKREAGRMISRLTSDIESLNALLTSGALTLITDAMTLVVISIIMVHMNVKLSLLTFAPVPFMVVATHFFKTKARLAYKDVRSKVATVTAKVAENVSGVRAVKSFSRERENLKRFERVNRESREAAMHAAVVSGLFWPAVQTLEALGQVAVLVYGAWQIQSGALTIGMIVMFIGYTDRFYYPVRNISTFYQTVQAAMAGAERIFEILDTEPTVQDRPDAVDMPPIEGRVEFKEVRFAYDDAPILKGISFIAEPGQRIALVGPTGAGKTTIISLLGRQYDIQGGKILIDGVDITGVKMQSLRRQMGIVLQDSFLFHGTVKENLRYGRLDATDQEIEAAAASLGLHEFIMGLPGGYRTEIYEGGSNVSTGQKQLLSFVRAVLADPRILVLDEATSSIDTQTELLIQRSLRKLLKGRTSFVIAHRLSTISEADQILVIQDGQIIERGTHEELLAEDGVYRGLHDVQFADAMSGDGAVV